MLRVAARGSTGWAFTPIMRAAVLAFLVALAAVPVKGADAPPVLYCPRVSSPPVIDGKLDDPVWAGAPVRYLLRQGALPPLHPCEVRMLWDAEALYVAFDSADQDVRSTFTERDAMVFEDGDAFELFLVLPGQKPLKVELETNPNGAFLDILYTETGTFEEKKQWSWAGAQWKSSVRGTLNDELRDAGWSAEMRLPWKGLAGPGVASPTPEGLAGLKVLLMAVDRIRADERRLSRELTTWPALSQMRTNLYDEYALLRLVERPADGPVEGYRRLIDGQCRRGDSLFMDYRGYSTPWEFDSAMADSKLVWESEPLPKALGDTVSLAFVGQTQSDAAPDDPQRTDFELLVNDRLCARFTPYQAATRRWENGEARLDFMHRTGKYWPSGLYTATVPSSWVKAGEPARLEVRLAGKGPRTRFAVKAWTDAALYERLHYGSEK